MPSYNTGNLNDWTMKELTSDQAAWVYNGLDCCVTLEVFNVLKAELDQSPENVKQTYRDSLSKQGPYMEISLRGIRIDLDARDETIKRMEARLDSLNSRFQRLCNGVLGHPVNFKSPKQLNFLFYKELGIKEIKKRNTKGAYTATTDEDALNRLCLHYYGQVFARYILAMRTLSKSIGFLKTEIDPDNRIRTNINIAGTNTGRLSSSANDFGTGTNLQNVDTELRYPFIADPKKVLANVDLEQADARNVAAIIWNMFLESHGPALAGRYLDDAESGDLHTRVARMSWPELPWGEDPKGWRSVADQIFIPGFTYRDTSKRIGHGTNYYGTPPAISANTHAPVKVVHDFQTRYFKAYPLIQEWQNETIKRVKEEGVLTTLYGRRRFFFGRGADKATWRKAIAYCPQSMTGHQIDMGILNLWRHMPSAELLMQVHDSILFQVPWHNHQTHIERALELLRFPFELKGGRMFEVPLEAKVGWNWGDATKENPFGIAKWKGEERRDPPLFKRLRDYL